MPSHWKVAGLASCSLSPEAGGAGSASLGCPGPPRSMTPASGSRAAQALPPSSFPRHSRLCPYNPCSLSVLSASGSRAALLGAQWRGCESAPARARAHEPRTPRVARVAALVATAPQAIRARATPPSRALHSPHRSGSVSPLWSRGSGEPQGRYKEARAGREEAGRPGSPALFSGISLAGPAQPLGLRR